MCGIFGVIAKDSQTISITERKELVNVLFSYSQTRGNDSSGVAAVYPSQIKVLKRSCSGSKLVKSPEYKRLIDSNFSHLIGHTRMETNGSYNFEYNNQPVVKDNVVTIHNGIIVNDAELWKNFPNLKQDYQVDTEVFNSLLNNFLGQGVSLINSVSRVYGLIEGSASVATLFANYNYLLLATNTGSLYLATSREGNLIIFASEKYILESSLKKALPARFASFEVTQLKPGSGRLINLGSLVQVSFDLYRESDITLEDKTTRTIELVLSTGGDLSSAARFLATSKDIESVINTEYQKNKVAIGRIKRCSKCILPETMPFIEFDECGVCNYCRSYKKQTIRGEQALLDLLKRYRRLDGSPEAVVAFSGGRDSSYSLHFVSKVLDLKPVAFSYDWGVLTDLGRRNQSRMCAKLGVEQILVSADIAKKRDNVRKNVNAWLKHPVLGTIPLFMAGDKQYFYYAVRVKNQQGLRLLIMGENPYEKTVFKNGFAGIKQVSSGFMAYHVTLTGKMKMLLYYATQFLRNPSYLNSSVLDSLGAYLAYFGLPHDYLNLYDYIRWDEAEVNKTLQNYNWELATDTKTTWRIGDGTAPFYNYIYYTLAGFTESDTFRSNQVREGVISREEALRLTGIDNVPRLDAICWYCNTIGFDAKKALTAINAAPKLYSS